MNVFPKQQSRQMDIPSLKWCNKININHDFGSIFNQKFFSNLTNCNSFHVPYLKYQNLVFGWYPGWESSCKQQFLHINSHFRNYCGCVDKTDIWEVLESYLPYDVGTKHLSCVWYFLYVYLWGHLLWNKHQYQRTIKCLSTTYLIFSLEYMSASEDV